MDNRGMSHQQKGMGGRHRVDADINARLRAYFGERLERYGHDPRGVDWQSRDAQRARFEALLSGLTGGDGHEEPVGENSLTGATLLDAGCGLGDFYAFLDERGAAVHYTGCDLSEAHVEAARRAYPTARFIAGDVRTVVAEESFDVIVACGLLHLDVPRWGRWAWDVVRAMYRNCHRSLAFTLPERGAGRAPVIAAVSLGDWTARLRTLSPSVEARRLPEWGDIVFVLRKPLPPG